MSRIFATGVSGTIGKHFNNQVIPINYDLRNSELRNIPNFKIGDCILHAAAVVGTESVSKDRITSHQVNVKASKMLAQFAKDNGVSRFIYVSTSHVYARSDYLLTESSPTGPSNIYAEQKFEAEGEISLIFRDCPEKLCIVRVFSVLDWDVADFTLGGGIKRLIYDNSNFTLNYGDDIRDFLTPRLIAHALVCIVKEALLTGIINLSSRKGLTVKDAAKIMLEGNGYKLPANRIVSGNSDYPYVVGDNSKLRKALPDLNLEWKPSRLNNSNI
jgi:nucleoside-diphosphate-sugar epimerase